MRLAWVLVDQVGPGESSCVVAVSLEYRWGSGFRAESAGGTSLRAGQEVTTRHGPQARGDVSAGRLEQEEP